MELKDLRKLTTKQIYSAIKEYADPEFAALAAWYVFHKKPPKKHISFIYNTNKDVKIEKRIIDIILNNYQQNRLTGQNNSLL